MTAQALSSVSVLELGHLASAAYATKLLADFGADVVKIEEVGSGDDARRCGPFPDDIPHPEKSGLFLYLNLNKRGVTLDVASDAGVSIFHELVRSADVLVHNYPPALSHQLGLDHGTLAEVNSGLITLSVTTYGETGPYRDFKGYELNAAALAGVPLHNGEAGRSPLYPDLFLGQLQAGVTGAVGVMLALAARATTGRGQHIDVAEADTWATMHTGVGIVRWLFGAQRTIRLGERVAGSGYPHTILPCKDGYFRLQAFTKREWLRALQAMGNPEWGNDPRFQDRIKMNELYADELDALILPWLMQHTKQELFDICYEYGVPFAPINDIEDFVHDPQLAASNFFVDIDHPEAGRITYPGPPYQLSATPSRIDRPAPLLGQHNEEVFCDRLGHTKEELTRLRRFGAI